MSDGRRQHDNGWPGISVARAAATCEHFPICWILGSKTICDLQKVQTTRLVKGGCKWCAWGRRKRGCRMMAAPAAGQGPHRVESPRPALSGRVSFCGNAARKWFMTKSRAGRLSQHRHQRGATQPNGGQGAAWSVSWPCRICRINAKCFKVVVDFGRARHRDWADCGEAGEAAARWNMHEASTQGEQRGTREKGHSSHRWHPLDEAKIDGPAFALHK